MSGPAAESASPDDRIFLPIVPSSSARRRLIDFLALEHPIAPRFVEIAGGDDAPAAVFRRRDGTPLSVVRPSRDTGAALFVQAASAAIFFAARGFPLEISDFEDALVEIWGGAPHLWLARPPRSVSVGPLRDDPPTPLLAALVPMFFGRASRGSVRIEPAARKLLDRWLEPFAGAARADAALIEIFRSFPLLFAAPFASVRRRCVAYRPRGFDGAERRHLAALDAAGLALAGRRPRVFRPGESDLLPFEALRSALDFDAADRDSCRIAGRLDACADRDTDWIRVDGTAWDDASTRLFEETAQRRGIAVVERGEPSVPFRPDEVRDAVWVASPDLAASIALYEALGAVAGRRPAGLRAAIGRFVSSTEHEAFVVRGVVPDALRESDGPGAARDVTGLSREERRALGLFLAHPSGAESSELARLGAAEAFRRAATVLGEGWLVEDAAGGRFTAERGARSDLFSTFTPDERKAFAAEWLGVVTDPRGRLILAVESGRVETVREETARVFGSSPAGDRPRSFDAVVAAASSAFGDRCPPVLRFYEADRRSELGGRDESRRIWESLADAPGGPARWRRRALLRLGASFEEGGGAAEAARAFGRVVDDPQAEPDEASAARRGLARIAAAEGRFAEADARIAEAEQADGLSEEEAVEVLLARAAWHGVTGDTSAERALYDAHREEIRRSSASSQFRFLIGEGTALSAARDHAAAAVRFAEALAAAREAGDRGTALLDLAVETFLLGDAAAAEGRLREAVSLLRAAGHRALARTAAANLVNLLLETGRESEAAPLVERLGSESDAAGDRKGRMLALAFRSRIAFRAGRWAESSADRREALALCAALGESIERQELEIDESDALLFAGNVEGARESARNAAERSDLAQQRESAARRVEDLDRWRSRAEPDDDDLARDFERAPVAAAERVARARAVFGPELDARLPAWIARARETLRAAGRGGFAEAALPSAAAPDVGRLRALREALAENRLPIRIVSPDGAVVRRSAAFTEALWTRPIGGIDGPLIVEGSGPDADLVAFLAETIRGGVERPEPAPDGEGGLGVLRASGIVTAHPAMEALGVRLSRVAPQNVTVFVSGESGTGKERIARAVHRLSPREDKPFVAVNVAAFPETLLEDELFGHVRGAFSGADRDRAGLFEAAHGGTLFLDEIADLPPALQAKLLRVLQEREIKRVGENRYRAVDVRLISATAKPLERAVETGLFREDLYYRVKVATLHLPPLRERGADVALLVRHFLEKYSAEYGKGSVRLTAAASAAFRGCPWPGNVRQLENTIMEAVALADPDATLDRDAFPGLPRTPEEGKGTYRERVDAFRRRTVEEALVRSRGNRTYAARDLGLTRQALLYLIRELGVRG